MKTQFRLLTNGQLFIYNKIEYIKIATTNAVLNTRTWLPDVLDTNIEVEVIGSMDIAIMSLKDLYEEKIL